jgi:membrane fusion protein, adhesin transport system
MPLFSRKDSIKLLSARPHSLVLWCILIFILAFFIWAFYFSVNQTVHAKGNVIAKARTQVIQSIDGGKLRFLYVKEGQEVKKNDLLSELDDSRVMPVFNDANDRKVALLVIKQRLEAELNNSNRLVFDRSFDNVDYNLVRRQIDLFYRVKKSYDDQMSTMADSLSLAQDEYQRYLELDKMGDVSHAEVLRIKRQLNEIKASIANFKNKHFQDIATELEKVNEDLSAQEQNLIDKNQLMQHTKLYSPVHGLVKSIKVTTLGGVLKPGDTLMEIVPMDSGFTIEAKVKPADMAFVRVGQAVNVKLDAYDYTIYGALSGRISYISPDSFSEQIGPEAMPFFRVLIEIEDKVKNRNNGRDINLSPGMTAAVDISTGNRSVLSLIFKPLIKTLNESF